MGDQVCIITGAGRGIGRAAAIELDRLGWRLVLVSRTREELEATAGQLSDAIPITADVTQSSEAQRIVNTAIEKFARIDASVHCAGAAPRAPVDHTTDEMYRLALDTNLSHTFFMTRALWPHFKARKNGVIVNLSSLAARDPYTGFAAYGAAKAAINTFSLETAREGAPHGIRVHVVAPGAVETQMLRSNFNENTVSKEAALDPAHVGKVIAQIVAGDLFCTSGEVLYVHR